MTATNCVQIKKKKFFFQVSPPPRINGVKIDGGMGGGARNELITLGYVGAL